MYYRGNGFPKRKSGHLLGVIGIYIVLLACVFAAWGQKGDNAHDGNNIVHAHYYFDFEVTVAPDDEHKRLYSWHEHKVIRDEHGHVTYDAWSHHGVGKRNIDSQNGDGHDGPVDKPETPTPPPPTTASGATVEMTLDEIVEPSSSYDARSSGGRTHFFSRDSDDSYYYESEPEPEPEPIILEWHEYQLFAGYTLIGFPVRPVEGREIQEFYGNNEFFDSPTEGILVHVPAEEIEQEWYFYNGEGVFGKLRIPLWSHFGMIVKLDEAEMMEMEGVPLEGKRTVSIRKGWNLIGLPELPSLYERPSDFLSDGICVVLITDETGFQSIGRAGDSGDDPLYPGQGLLLQATAEMRLDLSSSVAAAPMARRFGILATSWGAMKERR